MPWDIAIIFFSFSFPHYRWLILSAIQISRKYSHSSSRCHFRFSVCLLICSSVIFIMRAIDATHHLIFFIIMPFARWRSSARASLRRFWCRHYESCLCARMLLTHATIFLFLRWCHFRLPFLFCCSILLLLRHAICRHAAAVIFIPLRCCRGARARARRSSCYGARAARADDERDTLFYYFSGRLRDWGMEECELFHVFRGTVHLILLLYILLHMIW